MPCGLYIDELRRRSKNSIIETYHLEEPQFDGTRRVGRIASEIGERSDNLFDSDELSARTSTVRIRSRCRGNSQMSQGDPVIIRSRPCPTCGKPMTRLADLAATGNFPAARIFRCTDCRTLFQDGYERRG